MTPNQVIAAFAVALVAAAVILFYLRTQKSRKLRERFGPEYDRAVNEAGNARAETILENREKRVKKFDIRPLEPTARRRFVDEWRLVQARFVDDPHGTISDADRLLGEVMVARGYP